MMLSVRGFDSVNIRLKALRPSSLGGLHSLDFGDFDYARPAIIKQNHPLP